MAIDVSTVKKLREYLDTIEVSWTDTDANVLGPFELTSVNVWIKGKGYAPAVIFADVDGSLILDVDIDD